MNCSTLNEKVDNVFVNMMDQKEDMESISAAALDRSLKLLDNALNSPRKSLLRLNKKQTRKFDAIDDGYMDINESRDDLTYSPCDGRRSKRPALIADNSLTNLSTSFAAGDIKRLFSESTVFTSPPLSQQMTKSAQDRLYFEFLEAWQNHTSEHQVFDVLLDFVQTCSHTLDMMRNMEEKTLSKTSTLSDKKISEIESERNTWRLIYALYQDRVTSLLQAEDMEEDLDLEMTSEKEIMLRLYRNDRSTRECQLVIDWLEQNASETDDGPGLEQFTDKTIAWENTLHELQSKRSIPYKSSRQFITELDPDAPRRQRRPLHDLDQEDEDRLIHEVFKKIRNGHLDLAQAACIHAGQSWRAALLEGWRLFHDPNYTERTVSHIKREPLPIEGNPNRDVWKLCAWRLCEDTALPLKTRASLAAYCGHLSTLLAASVTWEDHLWSYLKTIIDGRVEREIRETSLKTYVEMPQLYWNNVITVKEVFNELTASKNQSVRKEAATPDRLVQKYLILDEIPSLMENMAKWIQGSDMSVGNDCEPVSPHFLRFLTHLVLFLRRIGRSECENIGDAVIEAYVKLLIEMKESKLVAWYVSQLAQEDQVYYYAAFLEEITDADERATCLEAAQEAGLNIDLITKSVVENIRQQSTPTESTTLEVQPDVSPEDLVKISALDWLLFYPKQRTELLIQANALIANFLSLGNVQAARLAFKKVPENTIDYILNSNIGDSSVDDLFINTSLNNLPKQVSCATKEYLCYKAYLEADESFSDWFQHFHNAKPVEPILKPGANFSEKVAHQHKYNQYKINYDRWKLAMENQTATTKTLLFNILTFPMGWLVDDEALEDNVRLVQLQGLRSIVIPKVTFLLHTVMHGMEDFAGCVALADLITAEQNKLYKVFTKQKLQDLLIKIAESSLQLIDQNKDPWGFPAS